MPNTDVGFVGLGRMGQGIAQNLSLFSQTNLHVFDTSQDAIDAAATDAKVATDLTAMARVCEIVFLCLPSESEVGTVLFGGGGLMQEAANCRIIVDTTTLDRSAAIGFAAELSARGVSYCDCPVSGMPFRAAEGTLSAMFGGDQAVFSEVEPLLSCFAKTVIYGGPVGSGQALKALNNIIYNVNIVALCEVLPLAMAVGLQPDVVARLVTSGSSQSFASDYFVPRMLERRFDTDFSLRAAYKDILNVQRMGIETRASLPVVNAMIASYQAAIAAGFGDEPKSAMLKVYEQRLGVQFAKNAAKDDVKG